MVPLGEAGMGMFPCHPDRPMAGFEWTQQAWSEKI